MPDDPRDNHHTAPGYDPKLFRTRSASILKDNKPKRPTAVTIKNRIIVINVHSNKRTLLHDYYQGIFSTLSKWRLSVDLISTSEVHVSMALHSESAVRSGGSADEKEIVDHDLQNAIKELQEYGTTDIISGMAIVSLVGKQMKNMVGIAGRMFSVLGGMNVRHRKPRPKANHRTENNINIEMISQGKQIISDGSRNSGLRVTSRS